jgi:hypothetical protein
MYVAMWTALDDNVPVGESASSCRERDKGLSSRTVNTNISFSSTWNRNWMNCYLKYQGGTPGLKCGCLQVHLVHKLFSIRLQRRCQVCGMGVSVLCELWLTKSIEKWMVCSRWLVGVRTARAECEGWVFTVLLWWETVIIIINMYFVVCLKQ